MGGAGVKMKTLGRKEPKLWPQDGARLAGAAAAVRMPGLAQGDGVLGVDLVNALRGKRERY